MLNKQITTYFNVLQEVTTELLEILCNSSFSTGKAVKTALCPATQQQNRSILSHNFIAQEICLGNCQFSIGKQSPNKHGFCQFRVTETTSYQ